MEIRLRCMIIVFTGCVIMPIAQAHEEVRGSHTTGAAGSHPLSLHSIESVLAQLHLDKIDDELIAIVTELTYGQTPAQVINSLVYFYGHTAAPLLTAAQALEHHRDYIGAAIKVAQLMLDMVPANSARSAEIQGWLQDLNTLLSCIEDVLMVLKANPQLVAMLLKNGQYPSTHFSPLA